MRVKLGEVCKVVSGTTPKSSCPEYWNGTLNWVTPAELKDDSDIVYETERKITLRAVQDTGLKPFPIGTVLLSSRAPIGKVAISGTEMYCNQGFKNLVCSGSIYNRYLYHFLKDKTEYLNALGRGATFKEISKDIVENIEIPLPPLETQRHIAAVLDKVSAMIALRRQQLDKLDELVKARFVEMFGTENDFDQWDCCRICDVADIGVGVVIKPTQYYADEGIPAFRSLNVGEMHVNDYDWVYFTKEGHQKNQKSVIHRGDVLVVRSGAPGTACVATEKYEGYNAVDIIIAHPDNRKVNSVFLAAFTNMPHGMNQIRAKTGGAAQQHFNVGGYKSMRLIMPSIELQNQFAAFVDQTEKNKVAVQQALEKLETLKKALMQEYFGGEV